MAKKEILNNDALTVRVGEGAIDVVEGVVDSVESVVTGTVDTIDRAVTVTKNNPWLIGGALLIGLGIGGFIGYKIATKRVTAKYEDDILPEQLAMAQSFRKRLAKTDEFESPEAAAQALIPDQIVDVVKTYQGEGDRVAYNNIPPSKEATEVIPAPEAPTSTAVDNNVFSTPERDPRDWDYRAEVAAREENPDRPYIISSEEFQENPNDHDQQTYTYYESDQTMVDEKSIVVPEVERYIGEENLRFGHGSGDINAVYVRNDDQEIDFEIIRDPGYYTVEVLGLDTPETTLRHSRQRGRRHRADE